MPQPPARTTDADLSNVIDALEHAYPKWWAFGRYFGAWATDCNERETRVISELVEVGLVEARERTNSHNGPKTEYRIVMSEAEQVLRALRKL